MILAETVGKFVNIVLKFKMSCMFLNIMYIFKCHEYCILQDTHLIYVLKFDFFLAHCLLNANFYIFLLCKSANQEILTAGQNAAPFFLNFNLFNVSNFALVVSLLFC